tara:strand:- start:2490 stop:3260 length:771 start_codon:yes stop_codon:yes gene_type:complete
MNKKKYTLVLLWIVLGSFCGLFISSFFGKTDIHIPYYHDLSNVLERTSPSVVNIWVIKKYRGWQEQSNRYGIKQWRQVVKAGVVPNGSGVVITENTIVTNFHVIQEAFNQSQELLIENYQGSTSKVLVIGFDINADIAVLKIINEIDVKPFKVRRDMESLRIGEAAIAIGSPKGVGQSFSKGIISAINRTLEGKRGNFIQTDASINPGNSGGALIDSKGRLIGVINFIVSTSGGNQGLNFAIPIDTVLESYENILN